MGLMGGAGRITRAGEEEEEEEEEEAEEEGCFLSFSIVGDVVGAVFTVCTAAFSSLSLAASVVEKACECPRSSILALCSDTFTRTRTYLGSRAEKEKEKRGKRDTV